MSYKVNQKFWELDEREVAKNAPAEGGDHFVDEDPLQVGPEPLEPDDSKDGTDRDED